MALENGKIVSTYTDITKATYRLDDFECLPRALWAFSAEEFFIVSKSGSSAELPDLLFRQKKRLPHGVPCSSIFLFCDNVKSGQGNAYSTLIIK